MARIACYCLLGRLRRKKIMIDSGVFKCKPRISLRSGKLRAAVMFTSYWFAVTPIFLSQEVMERV
jgi:hypothetical protein